MPEWIILTEIILNYKNQNLIFIRKRNLNKIIIIQRLKVIKAMIQGQPMPAIYKQSQCVVASLMEQILTYCGCFVSYMHDIERYVNTTGDTKRKVFSSFFFYYTFKNPIKLWAFVYFLNTILYFLTVKFLSGINCSK